MEKIDRRQFIQRAGLGAGAAGALWVAPSVMGFDAAFAGTSCVQQDTLVWLGTPPAGLGATGTNPPASKTFPIAGSKPAVVVGIGLTSTAPAPTLDPNNFRISQQTLTIPPDTGPATQIGGATSWLNLQFTTGTSGTGGAGRGEMLTFTFTPAVTNLRFTLLDIDGSHGNGATDYADSVSLAITGTQGFSGVPTNAQVSGAGTTASPWVGSTLVDNSQSSNGNVPVTIPGPITGLTIRYTGVLASSSKQVIGISDMKWCR